MANFKIAVLSGDGIGPEVIAQGLKSLKAVETKFGHSFEFKEGLITRFCLEKPNEELIIIR